MKITAEIVNGKCPTCDEFTMLVGLTATVYRCMNCGTDLEQHVNGKISYLPHITRSDEGEPFEENGKMARQKFVHFVPRPKPRKRPGRHTKNLNKSKKRSYKKYNRQGRPQ